MPGLWFSLSKREESFGNCGDRFMLGTFILWSWVMLEFRQISLWTCQCSFSTISFGFVFIITELEVSWGMFPRCSVSRCIWEIGYKLLMILSTPFILTWSSFKKRYGGSLPPGRNKWSRCTACSRALLNELSKQPASGTAGSSAKAVGRCRLARCWRSVTRSRGLVRW